uniref:Uncharacterized protein n=1 Tax=Ciona savignyi TaxID=51511 RepID=H2YRU8_CIOSA
MKFKIVTSLLAVVLCATVVNPQRRRNNNRNRPNRNRVTVAPTVGGKWRPRQPTRTRTTNRRPSTVNRRPQVPRPTGELITPPSRRMEGEAALQEPSWVHCLHNMEITSNWAMINNQGYPSAIVGQMQ